VGARKAFEPLRRHMPKKDKDLMGSDQSEMHDELGQNLEENEAAAESIEEIVGEEEVEAAEEAAINIDNETATEATNKSEETAEEEALEKELAAIEPEKKHKNRESTSEKAKKAAATRVEKGLSATLARKQLDPLRLRSKKYREVVKLVDAAKVYTIEEAAELIKKTSTTKFDAAVELHAKIKVETTRGTISLPHGTGKTKKVAIADEDTLEKIAAGKFDFDVLIATPAQMPKLAKFAKVLGPKGLMPSPKAGTVTDDLDKVAKEIGGGRLEYRTDKNGVIHLAIGRVSFKAEQIVDNFKALEPILLTAKVTSISLATTMGPGVKVQIAKS
jgi:large subunit ribosomal protein L1